MAFTQKTAIEAVKAHGFSFLVNQFAGKIKHSEHVYGKDTIIEVHGANHDTYTVNGNKYFHNLKKYSWYHLEIAPNHVTLFSTLEEIRVYLCSLTEEKLRQENERMTATTPQIWTSSEPEQEEEIVIEGLESDDEPAENDATRERNEILRQRMSATAAELERIDQETQAHIESELAADSSERSDMWHIANNSYGGAPELSPDAAEPAPEYADPIINEEPLNFNDNLGDKLSDLAKLHGKIIRAYSPDDLPSFTRYELVTVAELAVNDRVCFDHDRIIDQLVQSIVYCGAGNYSVVCDDTHYPYEVTRDTSVYRVIEPAAPNE